MLAIRGIYTSEDRWSSKKLSTKEVKIANAECVKSPPEGNDK